MNAAFFDIDGTLLATPSLERRLFRDLCWKRKIPTRNYLRWVREAVRLGLRDLRLATHGNKEYLRGLAVEALSTNGRGPGSCGAVELLPAAVQRVWWHAMRGDSIVLVSGTLQPLGEGVKFALERELLWRGVDVHVTVLATRLEVREGRCTGRVLGAPVFGEEKERAIRQLAARRGILLSHCSAYGDSALDRWMLAAVGNPCAVNPDRALKKIAGRRGWPLVSWTHGDSRTKSASQRTGSSSRLGTWKRRSETAR
jgi:HAD superfamily hydrolase (TIGR01490 family)